jgi:hypothetical protein
MYPKAMVDLTVYELCYFLNDINHTDSSQVVYSMEFSSFKHAHVENGEL